MRMHNLVIVVSPTVSGILVGKHKVKHSRSFLTPSKKVLSISSRLTLALGFDDDHEWSTATTRKRRRAKKDEDEDEDYMAAPQPKPVTEDGVAKIMSSLLQAREQWVIIKLLTRLETSDNTAIWHRVLKMHGYQILGAVLREWQKDNVIVTTVYNLSSLLT